MRKETQEQKKTINKLNRECIKMRNKIVEILGLRFRSKFVIVLKLTNA